jgi:hypothetical protein
MTLPLDALDQWPVDQYLEHLQSLPDSVGEIDRESARERGSRQPHICWISSDRDAWYRNPYYQGPDQPHPDDQWYDETPLPPSKPDPLGDIFPPIDPAPPFVNGQDFDMPF